MTYLIYKGIDLVFHVMTGLYEVKISFNGLFSLSVWMKYFIVHFYIYKPILCISTHTQ